MKFTVAYNVNDEGLASLDFDLKEGEAWELYKVIHDVKVDLHTVSPTRPLSPERLRKKDSDTEKNGTDGQPLSPRKSTMVEELFDNIEELIEHFTPDRLRLRSSASGEKEHTHSTS